MRPNDAHFQSHLGFLFQQYQAAVSLTSTDDHIFCFYLKPPLTFSNFLEKPVKLQLSFSLRMADGVSPSRPRALLHMQSRGINGRIPKPVSTGVENGGDWYLRRGMRMNTESSKNIIMVDVWSSRNCKKVSFSAVFVVFILLMKLMTF